VQRLTDNLLSNGVEEVARVSIYLQPSAGGRPIMFYGADGQPVDHLALDAQDRRRYVAGSGAGLAATRVGIVSTHVTATPKSAGVARSKATAAPTVDAGQLPLIINRWELDAQQAGLLIASHSLRVTKLLRAPDTRLCVREQDRLILLVWIDDLLAALLPSELPPAEWLRGLYPMGAFSGATVLQQLHEHGLEALKRLCAALCHIAEEGPPDGLLMRRFDEVLIS
jgi:hypothetical protein